MEIKLEKEQERCYTRDKNAIDTDVMLSTIFKSKNFNVNLFIQMVK